MTELADDISEREFQLFQQLMYRTTGVALTEAKKTLVVGRLSSRLRQLGLPDYATYYRYVTQGDDPNELQRLIDVLTTHETYFFREERHFQWLAQWARQRSTTAPRLWSAACSSGEEVWTMAMVLADTLGTAARWSILGSDISAQVVAQARAAHYDDARTRGLPDAMRRKYCLKGVGRQEGTFLIDRSLRDHAEFEVRNLLEIPADVQAFDVIFLRNVMIYFDPPTKKRVVENLLSQLKPEGYLVVGHSESLNGLAPNLVSVQPTIYGRSGHERGMRA